MSQMDKIQPTNAWRITLKRPVGFGMPADVSGTGQALRGEGSSDGEYGLQCWRRGGQNRQVEEGGQRSVGGQTRLRTAIQTMKYSLQ